MGLKGGDDERDIRGTVWTSFCCSLHSVPVQSLKSYMLNNDSSNQTSLSLFDNI